MGIGLLGMAGFYLADDYLFVPTRDSRVRADEPKRPAGIMVEVLKPQVGGMDRTTTQPGTVLAYESVPLYAAVSGYLKTLTVDIGARVTEGQVLAEIDVPE